MRRNLSFTSHTMSAARLARLTAAAFAVSAFAPPTFAQAPAAPPPADTVATRKDVMAVVNKLFDGMHAKDTAVIRSTLHPAVALISAGQRPTGPIIEVDSVTAWLRSIATPRPESLDERIFNEKVQVDGTLASVWVDYSFYIGPKLSHCGVDAFQIAKGLDGWKIIALADTRRRTGCTEVPAKK